MADTALADPPVVAGRVTVADRVAARVAARAAGQVSTPVRRGPTGTDLPHVDVDVAGNRVRVAARVAGTWPEPAAAVAGRVADAVRTALGDLVGLQVDDVLVTVEAVVAASAPRRRVS